MAVDLKQRFAQLQARGQQIMQQRQQLEYQFTQQRQAYEHGKRELEAEANFVEGQAHLLLELDPSLAPQGPQDVNPEALKPQADAPTAPVRPVVPESPAALAGTVPVAPPMEPPAPNAQSVPAVDVVAAHEHAVAGGELPSVEPAAPAAE